MRSLMNPRWLIVINTIPVIILAAIFFGAFQIVESLLNEDNIYYWIIFGSALLLLWLLTLVYAILSIWHQQKIHPLYGFISLIFHIPFLYFFADHFSDVLPRSIPSWMLPDNMILYMGSFLMPTLGHALLTLVVGLTPEREQPYRSWKNFALAFAVPLAWYFFIEVILPLWQPSYYRFEEHLFVMALLSCTVLFLLFLARGVYILSQKKGAFWKEYELFWKIPVAIIFPLMGLALNNGLLSGDFYLADGVFGDFHNSWFYILAIVNGLALCIPNPTLPFQRLFLFAVRSITFSYTLYFFLVFVPFFPLSVIAILVFGAGFLMLTPLLLMVLHSMDLGSDFQFLKNHYSSKSLTALLFVCALTIPASITYDYAQDRHALHAALEYVYQSDIDQMPSQKIKTKDLARVLKTLRAHKKDSRDFGISIGQTPFLSPLYTWLVLDNLTLSESKINLLESTFFGGIYHTPMTGNWRSPDSDAVSISQVAVQSEYDATQEAWLSWVDLDITNYSGDQKEFVATFDLPNGAWISDYYLWIEGEKVPGILAEKKTATWIYQKITNTRRDPGILYYLQGNKVAFRVFPFNPKEVRKTGFQILHKESIELEIDQQKITLGTTSENSTAPTQVIYTSDQSIAYIPKALKSQLPEVQRKPYYHFIVDCSAGKDSVKTVYVDQIQKLLTQNSELAKHAKVTFTNAYLENSTANDDWKSQINAIDFSGGFNLERAIKSVLLSGNHLLSYPQIIVLSPAIEEAILPENFIDFMQRFPEVQSFQVLDEHQTTNTHSLNQYPSIALADTIVQETPKVVAWPDAQNPKAVFPATPDAEVLLLRPTEVNSPTSIRPKNWEDALALQGQWLSYTRYPGNMNEEWKPLVKNSFSAQVMTPVTSFISLENEAQRMALLKKQEQVLQANQALDIDEDTHRMSEPSFFVCLFLLLLWGVWYRRNKMRLGDWRVFRG